MSDVSTSSPWRTLDAFIEAFGEAVDEKWPEMRRAAARMVAEKLGTFGSAVGKAI